MPILNQIQSNLYSKPLNKNQKQTRYVRSR